MYTVIAKRHKFNQGAPRIQAPDVYGASPEKPILYRIPVLGERPMNFTANLPEGLSIDAEGIISGEVGAGEYAVTVTASNSLGSDRKEILFHIAYGAICQTPLMGWTSWNAFVEKIDQNRILEMANLMRSTGLADFGYQYVNIDSEWQGSYGDDLDAIQPNEKFPDMKKLCDDIHSLGLKCGIYSTPMMNAFGRTRGMPGCTRGQRDPEYMESARGIALEHYEENNVKQWCQWGFDYLKYDWRPCDTKNADLMRKALDRADRDFGFSVTVKAMYEDREYWKANCSSWRDNRDSEDNWDRLTEICFGCDKWLGQCSLGHYFDLDMLEIGVMELMEGRCKLTEDEQLVGYTARVIFPSPIQISCDLSQLTEFELDMLCNEEVIAINQDALGKSASCVLEERICDGGCNLQKHIKIYEKPLKDGKKAAAVFNLGNTVETIVLDVDVARDLWAKQQLTGKSGKLEITLMPHTVRLLKY